MEDETRNVPLRHASFLVLFRLDGADAIPRVQRYSGSGPTLNSVLIYVQSIRESCKVWLQQWSECRRPHCASCLALRCRHALASEERIKRRLLPLRSPHGHAKMAYSRSGVSSAPPSPLQRHCILPCLPSRPSTHFEKPAGPATTAPMTAARNTRRQI
jgi:hypothetical protein